MTIVSWVIIVLSYIVDAERGTLEHIFNVNLDNKTYLLYGIDK